MDIIVTARRLGTDAPPLNLSRYGEIADNWQYSTRLEEGFGGHDVASFTFKPRDDFVLSGLIEIGDRVKFQVDGATPWAGQITIATPGEDGAIEVQARGNGHALKNFLMIDYNGPGDYTPTSSLVPAFSSAMDQYGLDKYLDVIPWSSLPSSAYTASTDTVALNTIVDVLTAWCRDNGKWWAVWDRSLVIFELPTTPQYVYRAGGQVLGTSNGEAATSVWVRFIETDPPTSAADYGLATSGSATRFGSRMFPFDVTSHGQMTQGEADDIAQNLYSLVKSRPTVTEALTCQPGGPLRGSLGGPALTSTVAAGEMTQVTDFRSSLTQLDPQAAINMPIGQTQVTGPDATVILTPLQPPAMTEEQIIGKALWRRRVTESEVRG